MPFSALATDLYELTMAAAYWENGVNRLASFELFVPALPDCRSYLIAAGLERALDYIANLRFESDEIEFLRDSPIFRHVSPKFFEYLAALRFQGEVWGVPEGTPVFAGEPLLRVSAPILEAQLLETTLLSIIGFETMVATKAARVVDAAAGRHVIEFGGRHAHGPDAAFYAARAAYLAGCAGTSNTLAGQRFQIPISGTMAHSFVMAYGDEGQSFVDFMRVFPKDAVLLVDTYGTLEGLERMIERGLRPRAVRLDSGDLASLSREVRQRLDAAGLGDVQIFATSDLDEFRITRLIANGAPIDAFGVGTQIVTSGDQPVLPCVYKLVEIESDTAPRGRAKLSQRKVTYPACKQVHRFRNEVGQIERDVIAWADEDIEGGEALLKPLMKDGRLLEPAPPLSEIREDCARMRAGLPAYLRTIDARKSYPITVSPVLKAMLEKVRAWGGSSNPT